MPTIDFSEVKDLEPIPNGSYDAEIVFAQEGVSKNDNPKIDLRWKVLAGEFAGRQVFDTLTFTQNSMYRVKNTLKALGFAPAFKGEVVGGDLIGMQATIVVSTDPGSTDPVSGEEYSPRNKVSKVKALGTASVKTLLG